MPNSHKSMDRIINSSLRLNIFSEFQANNTAYSARLGILPLRHYLIIALATTEYRSKACDERTNQERYKQP